MPKLSTIHHPNKAVFAMFLTLFAMHAKYPHLPSMLKHILHVRSILCTNLPSLLHCLKQKMHNTKQHEHNQQHQYNKYYQYNKYNTKYNCCTCAIYYCSCVIGYFGCCVPGAVCVEFGDHGRAGFGEYYGADL